MNPEDCITDADLVALAKELQRKLAAMTAEREEDRKALERLHHEIGIDLPDEGMTILQLVGNLLAASHEKGSAEIASVRDTASAMLSALAVERNAAMTILDPSGETQSLVDAARETRARADASVALAKDLSAVTAELEHLKAELDGVGVHSCGVHCARPACVLRRERDLLRAERDAALATLAQIAGKTPGKFPTCTGPGLAVAHERAAARLLDALAILAENPEWKAAKDRVDQCEDEVARLESQRIPEAENERRN